MSSTSSGDERDQDARVGSAVDHPTDIAELATVASKDVADLRDLPVPSFGGRLGGAVERDRVFEQLFDTPAPPQVIGRYVVRGTLGEGAMGTVLEAFDPELDRRVALKVLHEEVDQEHTTRIKREAQALAKLSHPNVVQVYEVGRIDERTFVAMELVQGQTLRQWMRRQPPPGWRACVEVFVQVGQGLAAAHEQGLVHRDFKPGNAIIDDNGRARVLDFGLARRVDVEDEPRTIPELRRDEVDRMPLDRSLTITGSVLGTPAYMPCEQMQGLEADARSDQFSFCVSLYEAIYGERPFEGGSMTALLMSVTQGQVRPVPKGVKVPAKLRAVLLRGLAVEPDERWASMNVLLAELRRLMVPRAGRWVVAGAGLMAGLGLVAAGLAYQADMGQRCTGARAQLAGVWDDARRQEVEAAILGTELSYAPSTWERVEARLTDYADEWAASHTEVCEATSVRKEQSEDAMDLRMRCLDERRTSLSAAVTVLAQADAEIVPNAVTLATGLPAVDRCDDLDWLAGHAQRVPPPEEPQLAAEVEQLRGRLAENRAEQEAGKYAEALERVQTIVERAETLGYLPLLAEAKARRGAVRVSNGQYAEAEQDFRDAYALAAEHGHDEVVLDAASGLTYVVGYSLERHVEGLQWGAMVHPLAKRSGEPTTVARSLMNRGNVLLRQGKYAESVEAIGDALELYEEALGEEHSDTAASLSTLASVLLRQGKYEEAEAHYRRVLDLYMTTLGEQHPRVADALGNLSSALDAQGKYEESEVLCRKALTLREASLGPEHPDVARSLNNLATVFYYQGEYEESEIYYRRGLELKKKILGDQHPSVATTLNNLGNVLLSQGRYEESEVVAREALELRERVLGTQHPDIAVTLNSLGNALSRQGKYEESLVYFRRALELWEKSLGEEHPYVAVSLNGIAEMFRLLKEYDESAAHYRRSLETQQKVLGETHPDLARPLLGLATVALNAGEIDTGRAYAERAVSIREANRVPPELLAEAQLILARLMWGDRRSQARARELGEQARDAMAALGPDGEFADLLAETERWLADHRVR